MKISVVVPTYNEEGNLPQLHARLTKALEACGCDHEIIYVDDGSRDGSLRILRELGASDPRAKFLSMSRNFGHEVAVAAGLDRAEGDAVVLIDADLQDPPELIKDMVDRWRAGIDVVYARRRRRKDPIAKKIAIFFFYRLLRRISEIEIPLDTGNFRVMDRRVVEAVKNCRENPRFIRGIVSWVGFKQEEFLYDRHERHAGETGYGFRKLAKLALDGICSFSLAPLRMTAGLGAGVIVLSVIGMMVVIVGKLMDPATPRGFAFLACVVLFTGGVQLFMLGMLAQYTGYILKNVQRRPMYFIAEEQGWRTGSAGRASQGVLPPEPGAVEVVVRSGGPAHAEGLSGG